MTIKSHDISPLFIENGIDVENIVIQESPGMYPHKEDIELNWSYYTISAFKHIKNTHQIASRDIAIIGIGSGVEAIAALLVFKDELSSLHISDISQEIVDGATKNILPYLPNSLSDFSPLKGSFCEPLHATNKVYDLIFANIPNLYYESEQSPTSGEEIGTFITKNEIEKYDPPLQYTSWALSGQFAYLQSAKPALKANGSVVCELGARVPYPIIEELFNHCEYKLREIICGFKEQTEPLIDFLGYHKLEKEYGVEFDFYLYNECKSLMVSNKIENPTPYVSSLELKKLFKPHRVSAGEALGCYEKDIKVGHIVQILEGRKR